MSDPVEIIMLSPYKRLVIRNDEGPLDDPMDSRDRDICCISFRENRTRTLPNQLNINREDHDYEMNDASLGLHPLPSTYRHFPIDWYEHGRVSLSLGGEGINCKFDTTKLVGYISIRKHYESANPAYTINYNEEEARLIARDMLKEYQAYLNGEGYQYDIEELHSWTNDKTKEREERRQTPHDEDYGPTTGFYDTDSIKREFATEIAYYEDAIALMKTAQEKGIEVEVKRRE